ncbi:hypothetical protein CBL_20016 [Carabus blaptoides fortunei]
MGNNAQVDLLQECEDKHILSDNRSPVILLKIAGMEFPALVDSGSQVSCLSRDVWDQIEGRTDMPIFPVTGVRISGAFKAKPKRITHQALIKLTYAIVLGTDWMRRVEAVVDLGHRCLTVETQTGRVRIPEATYTHHPASGESLALFISSTWMPAGSLALCTPIKRGSDEQRFNKVLDDSNMTGALWGRLDTLLKQNKQVFSEKPGRVAEFEHSIEVTDDSPFQQKAYPIPVAHREAKNCRWIWTAEAQKAFDEVEKLISDATLLYRPRRDCRFYVQTDASDVGLGAQLFQVPIIPTGPNDLVAMDLCVFQVSDTPSGQEGEHQVCYQPSVTILRDRRRTAEADPH